MDVKSFLTSDDSYVSGVKVATLRAREGETSDPPNIVFCQDGQKRGPIISVVVFINEIDTVRS